MNPPNTPLWDDCAWSPLPQLEGEVSADLCVIGLGGSGLSAVLEGLRLGLRVIGIDAGSVAGGAAGRNGGFLMAGAAKFYHELVADLGRDRAKAIYALTVKEIDQMTAQTPRAIRRVGSLRIASSSDELEDCALHLQALLQDGFQAEQYAGLEGTGVLIPSDAAFNPLQRCRTLALIALERGAKLFEQSAALEISGNTVQTARGTVHARHVIVCVDGRLEMVFPELAPRVRTARLQMLGTAPDSGVHLPRPVYARWGYEYWQQLPDGRVTLGGFRDAEIQTEWTSDGAPTDSMQTRLETYLRGSIGVTAPITHRWAASVSYTLDGQPLLEQTASGAWAVGAYSGTGNVIGALCGRAAAQLAVTGGSSIAETLLQKP
jgi:gamma-glutamylputrescine oxidase